MMLCRSLDKADLAVFAKLKGKEFVAEEKYDGDRVQLHWKSGQLALISRGKSGNVTIRYPELHSFSFPDDVVLDGEMCVLDENGKSLFNEGIAFRTHCVNPNSIASAAAQYPVTFVAFDLLEHKGENLRMLPWHERRKRLEGLNIDHNKVKLSRFSDDILGLWADVTSYEGEGIILKRRDSPYMDNKRSSFWLKVKDIKEVDITVTKMTTNNAGIRVETEEGIACQVAGYHAPPVAQALEQNGEAVITIRHLGFTGTKYRQPTFCKLVR